MLAGPEYSKVSENSAKEMIQKTETWKKSQQKKK
jgi:hypothetical protein